MEKSFIERITISPINAPPEDVTASTTYDVTIPRYDLTLEQKSRLARKFAANEPVNFIGIDNHVDNLIGVIADDLSFVQSLSTDPAVLVQQVEHLLVSANRLLDGVTDDKVAIRQRNQLNLEQPISVGEANDDLKISDEERRRRIINVLFANRSAREGQLELKVFEVQADFSVQAQSIEDYRRYLANTDPAQLMAFNTHFVSPAKTEYSDTMTNDHMLTRTEELEEIADASSRVVELKEVRRLRIAQTRLFLASKAVYATVQKPLTLVKHRLTPPL